MKKLTKIKLVNWHIFSNETIELRGNTLITGENGSGKSTILDAMQYVLTAGTKKFNMAANENSTRTLESYIRGKLGIEGKEYLRTKDVVCHIALEFYNENSSMFQVLGAVIEVGAQARSKSNFYKADHAFSDDWFLEGNQVLNYNEFKQRLKGLQVRLDIPQSSFERQNLFMNTLGLESKYRELIPKALAFRPVNDIEDFMYRYLLNEINVDIESLRDSIRDYRRLEKQLEQEQIYFRKLESIHHRYQVLQTQQHEVEINKITIGLLKLDSVDQMIKEDKKKQNEIEQSIAKHKNLRDEYCRLSDQNQETLMTMKGNPSLERLTKLREDLKQSKIQYELNEKRIEECQNEYAKMIQSLKKVEIYEKMHTLEDTQEISDQLSLIQGKVNEKSKEFFLHKNDLKKNLEILYEKQKKLEENMDRLKKQQQVYPDYLKNLIGLLRQKLSDYYREDVGVRPLFEYLEISDESWRNAIEGYLNTQRFNIIVEPRYFDMAIKLYDQYKHELKIYGVRIVDVMKTRLTEAKEGSLACYILTKDTYVQGYINYLLGSVMCVESVAELRNHHVSITKSTMVYKGYAVYAIRPEIYQHPYIGQAAIVLQMERCKAEHSHIMQTILEKRSEVELIKNKENLLSELNLIDLKITVQQIENKSNLFEVYKLNESAVKQIESDPDLTTQIVRIQELEERSCILREKISLNDQEIGQLSNTFQTLVHKIERFTNDYATMKEIYEVEKQENMQQILEAEQFMVKILQDVNTDYQKAMDQLQILNKTLNDTFIHQKTALISEMVEYNQLSNSGYGNDLESIDQYIHRYYRLRDVDLIESTNSCRQAREKSEHQFHESFIHQLAQNMKQAHKNVNILNKQLKKHFFRDEQYQFDISASKTSHFAQYYKIIISEKETYQSNLFMQNLSQQESDLMKELFRRISAFDDTGKNEAELRRYTDYRNYMSYDIVTKKVNGDITRLSTVIKEKSGGETQTPFYVTIAASFEQLISKITMIDSGCVVLFDEAFNNMDSERIRAMLEFYKNLSIQIVIAVPPERIASISEHVDTILAVGRYGNSGFTQRIQYGKDND